MPRRAFITLILLAATFVRPVFADPPLVPGNIVVHSTHGVQDVFEYTPAGVQVRQVPVTPILEGRDLVVDRAGRVQLFNGTFEPMLTQYDPATGAFSSRAFAGWSTVNNLTYGGIGTIGRHVFVTDMVTGGDGAPGGVIRFDLEGGPTTRFAANTDPIDLNVGRDGLLYTLSIGAGFNGGGNQIDVFDPDSLAFIRTVMLPDEVRGIAVGADGHIYAAQQSPIQRVTHYDPNGVLLDSILDPGIGGFADIDLNQDGGLVIASHSGAVLVTTIELDAIISFDTVVADLNYATWVPVPEPSGVLIGILGLGCA